MPFPGEPILTATATDAAGTTSESSPPLGYVLTPTGVTFAAMTHAAVPGTVATFSSSDPTATATDFTATINYGDGSPGASGTVVAAPDGFLVVGTHLRHGQPDRAGHGDHHRHLAASARPRPIAWPPSPLPAAC